MSSNPATKSLELCLLKWVGVSLVVYELILDDRQRNIFPYWLFILMCTRKKNSRIPSCLAKDYIPFCLAEQTINRLNSIAQNEAEKEIMSV